MEEKDEITTFDKTGRLALILVIIAALIFGAIGIIDVVQEKNGTYVTIKEFIPEMGKSESGVTIACVRLNISNAYSKAKTFKFTVKIVTASNAVVAQKDIKLEWTAHNADVKAIWFETNTNFDNCHAVLENIVIE